MKDLQDWEVGSAWDCFGILLRMEEGWDWLGLF